MSLLDNGCHEDVVVYPEVVVTDVDGNIRTKASDEGIAVKARVQVQGQSGTSARRAEQDVEGFESEKVYTIRFPRSFKLILGAQSKVVWKGMTFSVFGDVNYYTASPRTKHVTYTLRRA